MSSVLSFEAVSGASIENYIDDLARLRMTVFREFPYLYEGSLEYEKRYLKTFTESKESILIVAKHNQKVVGVSTGLPLKDEEDFIVRPFLNTQFKDLKGFYFSESVLLKEYRGQGAGQKFFQLREEKAKNLNADFATFCAVVRPVDHPRRPKGYKTLESFWQKQGFQKMEGVQTQMAWRDLDEASESTKTMQFWVKTMLKAHHR